MGEAKIKAEQQAEAGPQRPDDAIERFEQTVAMARTTLLPDKNEREFVNDLGKVLAWLEIQETKAALLEEVIATDEAAMAAEIEQ